MSFRYSFPHCAIEELWTTLFARRILSTPKAVITYFASNVITASGTVVDRLGLNKRSSESMTASIAMHGQHLTADEIYIFEPLELELWI